MVDTRGSDAPKSGTRHAIATDISVYIYIGDRYISPRKILPEGSTTVVSPRNIPPTVCLG